MIPELCGILAAIILVGTAIKIYLKRKLDDIDGFTGICTQDDKMGKAVGIFEEIPQQKRKRGKL